MATNRTDLLSVVLLSLLAVGFAYAAPLHVENFTEAMAKAKDSGRPVAVYVHGSSWHVASRTFKDLIWGNEDFYGQLQHNVILTDIDIRQNLDETVAKEDAATRKDWDSKTVRTYPAVQIYAPDGFLLETIQGREIRMTTSASALATRVESILEFEIQRRKLLSQSEDAHAKGDAAAETSLLIRLIELPVNRDPGLIDRLKTADPSDSSGWQARLSFKDWGFIREVTRLIEEMKPDEALAMSNKLLESERFEPKQRALILGARGMALAAKGDLNAAWEAFGQARDADPKGANGNAVWRYGIRVAGIPLRAVLPPESSLTGKDIGENISKEHATYTLSSENGGDPASHDTLFTGAPAESGFAFHTAQEKDAHIVIDLEANCQIHALRIKNRESHTGRAESLTLWTSENGSKWTKAWTAAKPDPAWEVFFEAPLQARYLKLGLDRDTPDFLHLHTVDIYGSRP